MQQIRVVVCSPSDVTEEREAVRRAADEVNRILGLASRVGEIQIIGWESGASPGLHGGGPQGKIDAALDIERADVVIGIFWRRFGTPVQDSLSGTEHELERAYDLWKQQGVPDVWLYFNQEAATPKTSEEAEQWRNVLRLKERFFSRGLVREYKQAESFEDEVRNDLFEYAFKNVPTTAVLGDQGYLLYTVKAEARTGASEGLTERCADIVLHFRSIGVVAGDLITLRIHTFLNTTVTNALSDSGENDAVIVSSTGVVLGRGRPPGLAGLSVPRIAAGEIIFEGIPFRCPPYGEGAKLIIRNVRCNAEFSAWRSPGQAVATAAVIIEASVRTESDDPQTLVAIVRQSLEFSLRVPSDGSTLPAHGVLLSQRHAPPEIAILHLRFTELFPGAFQKRHEAVQGTRLKAVFRSIPSGTRLYVSIRPLRMPECATLTAAEVGDHAPLPETKVIDGIPVAEVTQGPATFLESRAAVWEVEHAQGYVRDYEFAVFVEYLPEPQKNSPSANQMLILGSLAPNPSSGAFTSVQGASSSREEPIPRYADTSIALNAIRILL